MEIFLPVVALGALGLIFGGLLGIAAKKFKVETDEKTELISELLPGANCGGCGYAGCSDFAKAITSGRANPNGCSICNSETLKEIAKIMNITATEKEKLIAYVMCQGDCDSAKNKFHYEGISDCLSAIRYSGGAKACSYGCLGYGSCINACKFDAISIKNGVAKVDATHCVGCSSCINACPRNIITLIPQKKITIIPCLSKDKGGAMKNICSSGCIGCKICEKNCSEGAVTVDNNLAHIDFTKCTNCGTCIEKCPTKVIKCEF